MTKSARLHQPGWLSGAFHFVILYVAFEAETSEAWPYALMAMAVVSFVAWAANYRRYRQIHDLPTSRIASAAQGYVELVGRAQNLSGTPLLSRLSRQQCCWYHYSVSRKDSDNKWKHVESGASDDDFLIVDDTGECVISPHGAEVLTRDHKSWTEGSHRYEESLLLPASVLYAIGEFSTVSGAPTHQAVRDENADVGALIAEWKRDQKRLHERFDINRDGTIDMKEWERARVEARREVRQRLGGNRAIEGVHTLRKPRDGRLFLLANEMPDALGARYRFWSWVHLVIFFGCGSLGLILL
jgi:putative ubiquitin-RnfH superfamily antitoxin RatB of RatAB toxin-antitoxin module